MKYIVPLFLFLILAGCSESPEVNFSKEGISFICPKGWKITEEEDYGGAGYYVACEKDGFNSDEMMAVTWYQDTMDGTYLMDVYTESLSESFTEMGFEITFKEPEESKFSNYESYRQRYEAEGLGEQIAGEIHYIVACDKSIMVLIQTGKDRSEESDKELKTIEKSFSCNN